MATLEFHLSQVFNVTTLDHTLVSAFGTLTSLLVLGLLLSSFWLETGAKLFKNVNLDEIFCM